VVSSCMKRDGRTLDHQTLETIRLMAIERVREGERPSEAIEAYGCRIASGRMLPGDVRCLS
jgi:hypothetical protein